MFQVELQQLSQIGEIVNVFAPEWHSRGQRFDPAYLHQTNHNATALWFELFKKKLRIRIPRKGARGTPVEVSLVLFPSLPFYPVLGIALMRVIATKTLEEAIKNADMMCSQKINTQDIDSFCLFIHNISTQIF